MTARAPLLPLNFGSLHWPQPLTKYLHLEHPRTNASTTFAIRASFFVVAGDVFGSLRLGRVGVPASASANRFSFFSSMSFCLRAAFFSSSRCSSKSARSSARTLAFFTIALDALAPSSSSSVIAGELSTTADDTVPRASATACLSTPYIHHM